MLFLIYYFCPANDEEKMILRTITVFVLVAWSLQAFCQNDLSSINFDRIPQKRVRQFITQQKENSIRRFDDLRASFQQNEDTSKYCRINRRYITHETLSTVWESYLTSDIAEMWNGQMVSFGVSVSKPFCEVIYNNDRKISAHIGQILYLNLKLLKGVYNLATAFEITEIDPEKKTIVFNYLEGGKSTGIQILRFRATDEGYTEIEHKTFFRSNSEFRDKRLYPFFHRLLIDEFHRNVFNLRSEKVKRGNDIVSQEANL